MELSAAGRQIVPRKRQEKWITSKKQQFIKRERERERERERKR